MESIFTNFIEFIMSMIKYIQELVGYFRAKNDGGDPAMPSFPSIGGDSAE